MSSPFLGQLLLVPYNFAPRGWAFCQGQVLSISQNTALFALIGTTYGGNGTTTFALPDLRGRVPVSSGQGPGLQNYTLGEVAGVESVTLTIAQMPAHSHNLNAFGVNGDTAAPSNAILAKTGGPSIYSSQPPNTAMSGAAIGVAGQGQPSENRPPFLVLNWVIALQGIFPSRN